MGMENVAILSYLEDDGRFADLFNQFFFQGRQWVKPISCPGVSWNTTVGNMRSRFARFREPTVERRSSTEKESMPMQGRYRQEDRIAPVYTICLYHGQEKWDGPRGLKDMVDFAAGHSEAEKKDWERAFIDYPMRLICANKPMDCSGFRTSLGAVFALLPLRGNKAGLERMLDENPTYEKLDEETAETISVLMGVKDFMEHKKELSNPTVTTAQQTMQSSANYRNTIPWKKQKHGKLCKPRHHPKYSRTAKAFPVFAK